MPPRTWIYELNKERAKIDRQIKWICIGFLIYCGVVYLIGILGFFGIIGLTALGLKSPFGL
jgi:hypothetical protein